MGFRQYAWSEGTCRNGLARESFILNHVPYASWDYYEMLGTFILQKSHVDLCNMMVTGHQGSDFRWFVVTYQENSDFRDPIWPYFGVIGMSIMIARSWFSIIRCVDVRWSVVMDLSMNWFIALLCYGLAANDWCIMVVGWVDRWVVDVLMYGCRLFDVWCEVV